MWWFIGGLFVGATITLITMSILIMASKADDQMGDKQYEEHN